MQAQTTATSLLSRIRDTADQTAWREFDQRYRELLLRFCWRQGISRTDSDDIVQKVFTSLAKTLPGFTYDRSRGRFRDYLYRCLRNVISDWIACPERAAKPLDFHIEGLMATARNDSTPRGGKSDPAAAAWEDEWVSHHYRLALACVRETFDIQSVELFDRMIGGAKTVDLASEHGLSVDAVHKVRQRVRDRMQELIARQIREEDEI